MKIEWRRRDSFWLAVVLAMAVVIVQMVIGGMYSDKMLEHYKYLLERERAKSVGAPADQTH